MTTLPTRAEMMQDPRVQGLVGKEKNAMLKVIYDENKAKLKPVPQKKLPSMKKIAELNRAYEKAYHEIKVSRETEKAVAVEVRIDFCDFETVKTELAWLPKSQLVDGQAPGWILDKKIGELYLKYKGTTRSSVIVGFA